MLAYMCDISACEVAGLAHRHKLIAYWPFWHTSCNAHSHIDGTLNVPAATVAYKHPGLRICCRMKKLVCSHSNGGCARCFGVVAVGSKPGPPPAVHALPMAAASQHCARTWQHSRLTTCQAGFGGFQTSKQKGGSAPAKVQTKDCPCGSGQRYSGEPPHDPSSLAKAHDAGPTA
jgi:hypothetical protein